MYSGIFLKRTQLGPQICVRFTEVSTLYRLHLTEFDQKTIKFGNISLWCVCRRAIAISSTEVTDHITRNKQVLEWC